MKKKEYNISISTITAAKSHTCDYCGGKIVRGSQYTKLESRQVKVERFGINLQMCHKHDVALLPFSLIWKRGK
jgi:hypothetical protein